MFVRKKIKRNAFTMAEVLVTLMIIGVIASITMPALRKQADMQENVAGVKKAYSSLVQATSVLEQKYGDHKRWRFDDTDASINKMLNYYTSVMNTTRKCEVGFDGCWAQTTWLNGPDYGGTDGIGRFNSATFSTSDGMNYSIGGLASGSGVNIDSAPEGSLAFFVDVNGDKKPNKLGDDVFLFVMTKDRGLVPGGIDVDVDACASTTEGLTCAARVLKEGKINY